MVRALTITLTIAGLISVAMFTSPRQIRSNDVLKAYGSDLPECNTTGLFAKHCSDAPGYECPPDVTYLKCKASEGSADNLLCKPGEGAVSCGVHARCQTVNQDDTSTNCKPKS